MPVSSLIAAVLSAIAANDDSPDFARDVRPIIANACFKCHGPDEGSRKAGLRLDTFEGATAALKGGTHAVVAGSPALSEILSRVVATDPDLRMPPPEVSAGLSAAQVDILRRWIENGAKYEPHWAFVAPVRPTPPMVKHADRVRTPIDAFILDRLEREGLVPSPQAEPHVLLTRVSLDLTGLPPTESELQSFESDALESGVISAYERAVDRLLASPSFGERWARVWLDLARYADTRGYEKDDRRILWPWRDWVIRAYNADMPYDEFTTQQLAGDLIENATAEQIIATGFHRNTMNNDEGGTDDEEFRVAAVIDRTNTTMQVWNGLTYGCAQCHTHKYDPITHHEYYSLLAFFNQTEDADRPDEAPTMGVVGPDAQPRVMAMHRQLNDARATFDAKAHSITSAELPAPDRTNDTDVVMVQGVAPVGAKVEVQPVHVGSYAAIGTEPALITSAESGTGQWVFTDLLIPHTVREGDVLRVRVKPNASRPATMIGLQILINHVDWEHRAYWGENLIPWGTNDTASRRRIGDMPASDEWSVLRTPVAQLGVEPGAVITGIALTSGVGEIAWSEVVVESSAPADESPLYSQRAWEAAISAGRGDVPEIIVELAKLDPATRTDAQREQLHTYYIESTWQGNDLPALRQQIAAIDREINLIEGAAPRVPVMRELAPAHQRTTHVFTRGDYRSPGDQVSPSTPGMLPPMSSGLPRNRLGLAAWLTDPAHPLTARVAANRAWEQFFGAGIVTTVEDFGTQGALPTHPELLDWLATEFVAQQWSFKALCRVIVTSSTYMQDSQVSPLLAERDPTNALLARGPRFRLDGEAIRDRALSAGGLLSPKLYGPPVFPRQPDGMWSIVYSSDAWTLSDGEDKHRRALYTFWRRTSPYPLMTTFDAGAREFCLSRRIRTNTPLQALNTLNDPAFIEPAQALARRAAGTSSPGAGAALIVRACLSREPSGNELRVLVDLYEQARADLVTDAVRAAALATDPLGPVPDGADVSSLAAWTMVANSVMNLDEFLTRE